MEDVIVVGAGPAGLAASWHLRQRGVGHVVLERGRVGETWRAQRWDSFTLNKPTWMSRLPGDCPDPGPADGFVPRDAWVAHLDDYARRFGLPVRRAAEVTGLEARPDGTFEVRLGGPAPETIAARCVVVASGAQREPRTPALAAALPEGVEQLHTVGYRNPAQLPAGAVLVVGSAQSGGQVVEDLLEAGRTVYLSTSRVPRVRRRRSPSGSSTRRRSPGGYARQPDPANRRKPLRRPLGRRCAGLADPLNTDEVANLGRSCREAACADPRRPVHRPHGRHGDMCRFGADRNQRPR